MDGFPSDGEIHHRIDINNDNIEPIPFFLDSKAIRTLSILGDTLNLNDEFLRVADVSIGVDERIYIKHYHSNSIRVYDKYGKFVYSIGRGGRGPGEFQRIGAFEFDDSEQYLYVIDEFGFKIEVFQNTGNTFIYDRSIYHSYIKATDICQLGDHLFISGYSISDTQEGGDLPISNPIARIHIETGNLETSFGYIYPSYSSFSNFSLRLSETMLSCNAQTQTVIGHLEYFPYLFGYNPEGEIKWISKLDGYVSVQFTEFKKSENQNPGLIRFSNKDIHNVKYPVQKLDVGSYSLLQFGWGGPQPIAGYSPPPIRSEDKEPRYRTILIDTETGELFHSDAYPLIGAMRNGKMVTYEILEPYQIRFSLNTYP